MNTSKSRVNQQFHSISVQVTCYIAADDAMFNQLILFVLIYQCSSICQFNAIFWRYYPCSILITAPTNPCDNLFSRFWIDRCENEEVLIFWHFPRGNLTLNFVSEKKRMFSIDLFTKLLAKNPSIESIYQLNDDLNIEKSLSLKNPEGIVTIPSDSSHQCLMKFQSSSSIILDYGIFIRLMIKTK